MTETVGDTYRARRLALRKGIREMERETGIHRARLSNIENGLRPSDAQRALIEAALARWEAAS